jgi:hypothetical protein
MPTADWTGFALTALGGVLAAGGGWVNGLAQSKRERGKEDRSIRRGASMRRETVDGLNRRISCIQRM